MEPTEQKDEPTSVADEKALLECEKLRTECEKGRTEIEVIRRPFYKNASFYVSLVPVILAVAGLLFTWGSGWFDVQRTRIENQKVMLQIETEKSRATVASLEKELQGLRADRLSLTNQIVALTSELVGLSNQISLLTKERSELSAAKDYFEKEAKRLAGSETNRLQILEQLKAVQSERSKLTDTNNELAATVIRQNDRLMITYGAILGMDKLMSEQKISTKQIQSLLSQLILFEPNVVNEYGEWLTKRHLVRTNQPPYLQVEPDPTNAPLAKPVL